LTFYSLTIDSVSCETQDTLLVRLNVPAHLAAQFDYRPGQHLIFKVPIDGIETRRSYSICSPDKNSLLEVLIKKIATGQFSNYAHKHFAPGQTVEVMAPQGQFCIEAGSREGKHFLLVAAGVGITPIISILQALLADSEDSCATLLYCSPAARQIIFRERLSWLKSRYMKRFQWLNVLSRETQGADLFSGRLTLEKMSQLSAHLIAPESFDGFYICGPPTLTADLVQFFLSRGIPHEHIHTELFYNSEADVKQGLERQQRRGIEHAGRVCNVTVRQGGREATLTLAADGGSILDAALAAGLDLPFSCKGGVCATCKAKLIAGQVDMDISHGLSADQLGQGFVLTCQAHPISDSVALDFDVT
jgi:ring-1,2-phenylacetyl-CoA epoxidase subunit PaaE